MKKTTKALTLLLGSALMLVGCSSNGTSKDSTKSETKSESVSKSKAAAKSSSEKKAAEEKVTPVKLTNSFVINWEAKSTIAYPPFMIKYPDNWSVDHDTYDSSTTKETVVLTSDTNASITITILGLGKFAYPDQGQVTIEATKAAAADFKPGYVQAGNFASLGKFAVAKLSVTKGSDTNFPKVAYALLPEKSLGTKADVQKPYIESMGFHYANMVSVIGLPSETNVKQSTNEVITIIKSMTPTSL